MSIFVYYLKDTIMLGTLIGAGASIYQMAQGAKRQKALGERPDLTTPDQVTQATDNARMLAGMKELSGQSRIEDKLRASTAQGASQIKQMGGGAAGMGAITDLYSKQQNVLSDLAVTADQQWERRQQGLQAALNNEAGYEVRNQNDILGRFDQEEQMAADLTNAGMMNMMGTAQTFGQNQLNNKALNIQQQGLDNEAAKTAAMLGGLGGNSTASLPVPSIPSPYNPDYVQPTQFSPAINQGMQGMGLLSLNQQQPQQYNGLSQLVNGQNQSSNNPNNLLAMLAGLIN